MNLRILLVAAVFCFAIPSGLGQTAQLPMQAKSLARGGNAATSEPLFTLLQAEQTGVDLTIELDWKRELGYLFYTGSACGGMAAGDVDGNGLPDLFMVGGPEANQLYLQSEPFKFTAAELPELKLSDRDQRQGGDGWGTGVAMFDVDNDGDLDVYVCNYDAPNLLYVNQGQGNFLEQAKAWGLDIVDASHMPSVCDYDRDGDLDIYLQVNRYMDEREYTAKDLFYMKDGVEVLRPEAKKLFHIVRHPNKPQQVNMWIGREDRLLRNEGPGKEFTDQSDQMGIERGDTLSATWWDFDHDGWPDLYVCNDLAAPDRLFHNNGDGTFTNVALEALPHTPWAAMGSSAGDVNNDGLVDFLAADMAFRTHYKDKVFMGNMSTKFDNISYFPGDQLMRNALYINTGTPHFQESAFMSGVGSTDWTWTAKLDDLDGDGMLDAFFTNGTPVSLTVSEQALAMLSNSSIMDTGSLRELHQDMPPVLERNLVYQNQGGLNFSDRSSDWGLDYEGMSFAAVPVDLDRDGDLDLVVANLGAPPHLYRNNSEQNHVQIRLQGKQSNRYGIGCELVLETSEGLQTRQVFPVSGFQSCQEAVVHFGVGQAEQIEKLTIHWPSGVSQTYTDLQVNQQYTIDEADTVRNSNPRREPPEALFQPLSGRITAQHHEEPYDDFARQPLLPNKLSQLGPGVAWGDVDGDGDLDLFMGEGTDWMGMIYLNDGRGAFNPSPQVAFANDAATEDMAAAFFDADGDDDLDLYVGSGSVECEKDDAVLQDRLYLNDGTGQFERANSDWLPDLRISTGSVTTADFDQDGDIDVFVGGRTVPGEYPLAPSHALLRNEGDHFVECLAEVAPDVTDAGMITEAKLEDLNGDGNVDLIVAIDWGPIRVYLNEQGKFFDRTNMSGLDQWTGWWQCVSTVDVDLDGDLDLVAGNFGLNTKYKATVEKPVIVYYGQYGEAESCNLIEASYEGDVLFPMRGKSCSSAAMPHLKKTFTTYDQFAKATLAEIYSPVELEASTKLEVNTLSSACFLNDGEGHFSMIPLPPEAQLSPIFALTTTEINGDGVPDLVLAQNFFTPQYETGPMDGGVGVLAMGKRDGTFEAVRPDQAGIAFPHDAKAVSSVDLDGDGQEEIALAASNGPLALYKRQSGLAKPQVEQSSQPQRIPAAEKWRDLNLELARQFGMAAQWDKALPFIRRALKVAPNDTESQLLLAASLRSQSRYQESLALLQQLEAQAEANPAEVLLLRGRIQLEQKQIDRAAETLSRAAASSTASPLASFFYGDALAAQGKLNEAQSQYKLALGQGIQEASGRLKELEARHQAAKKLYTNALRLQVGGDDAEAAKFYRESLRANSQRVATLNNLSWVLGTSKNEEVSDPWLAIEYAKRAVRLSEGNPNVLDTLARVYAGAKNYRSAVSVMQQILKHPEVQKDSKKLAAAQEKLKWYQEEKLPPS